MRARLSLLLILYSVGLFAQTTVNKVIDFDFNGKTKLLDKTLFQDILIIFNGVSTNTPCFHFNLYAYDLFGNRLWGKLGYHEIIHKSGNILYTAGFTYTDDIVGYEQVFVSGFKKDGDEILRFGYPEVPHDEYFNFVPTDMHAFPDNTFLITSQKSIIKLDSGSHLLSEKMFDFNSAIGHLESINPNSLLLGTMNIIYKMDSSYSLSDSMKIGNEIIQFEYVDNKLAVLTSHQLIELNASLQIIDTLFTCYQEDLISLQKSDNGYLIQLSGNEDYGIVNIINGNIIDTSSYVIYGHENEFINSDSTFVFIGISNSDQIQLYFLREG